MNFQITSTKNRIIFFIKKETSGKKHALFAVDFCSVSMTLNEPSNLTSYLFIAKFFFLGTTFFERKLKRSGAKLIFDFDDSIWLLDTSAGNQKWKFLKNEHKTANIIRLSDAVIAGNAFLASYARAYNQHVTIIPSTVDTAKYMPSLHDKSSETVTIGWSGSPTTVKHFETILPALEQIKEKYGERVRFALMGDGSYHHTKLEINGIAWNSDTEVNELSNFDIG